MEFYHYNLTWSNKVPLMLKLWIQNSLLFSIWCWHLKRYFCEQISDIFYSPYSLLQGKLLVKQQNWDQALKFVNLNNVFLIFHWNEDYNFLEKRILKWMGIMCGVCWIYQIPGAPQSFWIPAYPPQPIFKINFISLSFVYQWFLS